MRLDLGHWRQLLPVSAWGAATGLDSGEPLGPIAGNALRDQEDQEQREHGDREPVVTNYAAHEVPFGREQGNVSGQARCAAQGTVGAEVGGRDRAPAT
jgi:hypothetical protein